MIVANGDALKLWLMTDDIDLFFFQSEEETGRALFMVGQGPRSVKIPWFAMPCPHRKH